MGSLMRRVPFWGDKNVMGLEVVVAKKKKKQLWTYCHWNVYFKMIHFIWIKTQWKKLC